MSRSGYSADYENPGLWRGAVNRATRGYRGQHLLRKLSDALDAMPNKRLITDAIKDDSGEVCTLGALDPNVKSYEAEELADHFGIARALAAEIVYMNDECYRDMLRWRKGRDETPEERWVRMRQWIEEQIVPSEAEVAPPAVRTEEP